MEIEELLTSASQIIQTQEQEWRKSGQYFNIFKTLRIETKELRHSAFLASLLNPNAFHGMENLFLKLFIEKIDFKEFPIDNAIVKLEETTALNKRFDISILSVDRKYKIVIENKINTGDRTNQIRNYITELKKFGKEHYRLVYLTLQGFPPHHSEISEDNLNNITCLSYKHDILDILENILCMKKELHFPIIEIIRQYRLTIKELTNQGTDDIMDKKIKELLLKDDNLAVVERLYKEKENLIESTLADFLELLYTNLLKYNVRIVNNPNPNFKILANNYLHKSKEYGILIRFHLTEFENADFQFTLENQYGEIWEEIKLHTPENSNTTYEELQKIYNEISESFEYKQNYINFKDINNDEFKKFSRMNEQDKLSYVLEIIKRTEKILATIKKNNL